MDVSGVGYVREPGVDVGADGSHVLVLSVSGASGKVNHCYELLCIMVDVEVPIESISGWLISVFAYHLICGSSGEVVLAELHLKLCVA